MHDGACRHSAMNAVALLQGWARWSREGGAAQPQVERPAPYPHHQAMFGSPSPVALAGANAAGRLSSTSGDDVVRLWLWIVAVPAVALYSGLSVLTGTLLPWTNLDSLA